MKEQKPESTLSLAILGLIAQRPLSGYDLRKTFATTPMGHFSSSPGAIYPALKRLGERGLVDGKTEGADTLRPKRVFRLTESGVEALRRELSRPITADDVIWNVEALVLRFAFMDHALGREAALEFLRAFHARMTEYLPTLETTRQELEDEGRTHAAMAVLHGVEQYAAHIRWATAAIQTLSTDSDTPPTENV
jgi:DNA-binding PadR family transcriptional regulator